MKLKGLSLFSSIGIAETYLCDSGVEICLANEIIPERAKMYQHFFPYTKMINGDITDKEIFKCIIEDAKDKKVDFIIATPPCQGMSLAGKMDPNDVRNKLIYYAVEAIKEIEPKFVLLENVPQQQKTVVMYNGKNILIPDFLYEQLSESYNFSKRTLVSAKDFGVPQMRKRNIILLSRKDMPIVWEMPEINEQEVTLRDILWDIPSLDPCLLEGEEATLKLFPKFHEKKEIALGISKFHYPPCHSRKLVITMMHTPSGDTAFNNNYYYPKKANGERVNGHYNTYRRHAWDKPCRTITQNNGVISSLCCVHPGKPIVESDDDRERLYSDARCFTIYELMLITSLPQKWNIPEWASEKLIRSTIGEGVPPLMIKKIVETLTKQMENK